MSDTKTSNPSFLASTAAPAPLSPAPKITILLIVLFLSNQAGKEPVYYLIFNVMMVNAARMMVTIQKRMVIFDSW